MILLEVTVEILSNQVAASIVDEAISVSTREETVNTNIVTQEVSVDYGFT